MYIVGVLGAWSRFVWKGLPAGDRVAGIMWAWSFDSLSLSGAN